MEAEHPPQDRLQAPRQKPHFSPGKIAIAAAIVIAAGIVISLHGGLQEVLRVPPTRDASTPASQEGYTLVDVVRKDPDGRFSYTVSPPFDSPYAGTHDVSLYPSDAVVLPAEEAAGLWIRTPALLVPPNPIEADDDQSIGYWDPHFEKLSGLHVTGKRPDGKTFGIPWEYFYGIGRPMLFVPIPGGYPSSLKYLDVIVTDNKLRVARWRIDRLPAAQHVIAGTTQTVDHFQSSSASITAEAVRLQRAYPRYDTLYIRLYPRLIRPSKQWDLLLDPPQAEWMQYDRSADDYTIPIPLTDPYHTGFHSALPNIPMWFSSPFVDTDRFMRMSGKLRQFDTLRETLTFRGLPVSTVTVGAFGEESCGIVLKTPLTQTTPSGVTVRLPRQSPEDQVSFGMADSINLHVDVSPKEFSIGAGGQTNSLPNSPLQRTYGKSPKLAISFSRMNAETMGSADSFHDGNDFHRVEVSLDDGTRTFDPKSRKFVHHPVPKTVDLTVTIDQRVDIREIPFAFTLPVHDIDRSGWQTKPWTVVQQ